MPDVDVDKLSIDGLDGIDLDWAHTQSDCAFTGGWWDAETESCRPVTDMIEDGMSTEDIVDGLVSEAIEDAVQD